MLYLRFVLSNQNPDTGAHEGIFACAYELKHSGSLLEHEARKLQELLNWLDDNLAVPSRFNRTKSKGYYRRKTKGISWLKSSALTHVAKMQQIASILKEQGLYVSMIKSARPGYIVYEDDHQIVAEPFADTTA